MKRKINIVNYNHDDILLICNNVEQAVENLISEFETLNKQEKVEVVVMFENTYVGDILKQLNQNNEV